MKLQWDYVTLYVPSRYKQFGDDIVYYAGVGTSSFGDLGRES